MTGILNNFWVEQTPSDLGVWKPCLERLSEAGGSIPNSPKGDGNLNQGRSDYLECQAFDVR